MNFVLEHWKAILALAVFIALFYVFLWGLLESGSRADDEAERRLRLLRRLK